MKTKLYSIKPEYLFGDDAEEKTAAQAEMVAKVGAKNVPRLGVAICTAEQAIELIIAGYCGIYADSTSISLIYEALQ